MIEERIKQLESKARKITSLGFILGLGISIVIWLGVDLDLGRSVYLWISIWFAAYVLAVQVVGRSILRLRPLLAWLVGLGIFISTLLWIDGFLTYLAPPALAFLVSQTVNRLGYLFNPAARYEDDLQTLLASSQIQITPSLAHTRVEELLKQHESALRNYFELQLIKAERAPTTAASRRTFMRVIDTLILVESLPDDLRLLLGRGFLGLARYQAFHDFPNLTDTLDRCLEFPLQPEDQDFVATQYATRGVRSKYAVKAFQAYFRSRRELQLDLKDPVYQAAREACFIDQQDGKTRLEEIEQDARGYLEADPRLGWAALALGLSLLFQDLPEKALEYLNQAADTVPDDAEPHYAIGMAHLALNDLSLAEDAFRDALSIDPRHIESLYSLGSLLIAGGRAENLSQEERRLILSEARSCLEIVRTSYPDRAGVYFNLGLVDFAEADYSSARSQFERALTLDPNTADWHYHYARSLVALGERTAAIDAAKFALELDPIHLSALLLLGEQYLLSEAWAETEDCCRRYLALDQDAPQVEARLGQALFEQGKAEEAAQFLKDISKPDRDALYFLGRSLAKMGDFTGSLVAYQRALEMSADAALYYAQGCAYASVGEYEQALEAFERSLALEVTESTYIQRGYVHLSMNDYPSALADYQRALEMAPESTFVHYALGVYYYRVGDYTESIDTFNEALCLDPSNVQAHLGLGLVLEASGELKQAQQIYEHALSRGASQAQTLLRLGVVASKLGVYPAAAESLTSARRAGVESDELLYHLGLACASTQRFSEAVEAWSVLQNRHPSDQALVEQVAVCLHELGYQHFRNGDYAAASLAWESCIEFFSNDENFIRALAEARFREGLGLLQEALAGHDSPEGAQKSLQKAGQLTNATDHRVSLFQALAALLLEDYSDAIDGLSRLYETNPQDGRVAYHLGYALWRADEQQRSIPYLVEATGKMLPTRQLQSAHLLLAEINTTAGKWMDAGEHYRAAFELVYPKKT